MSTVKAFTFACAALLTLTGGKCSFISSFDSDDDDDDEEEEGVIIVVSNAEMTTSDVIGSLTQTLMVADVSSQSAQYINNLNTSLSSTYTCDEGRGTLKASVVDLDNSNSVSRGDDLILNYENCDANGVNANGELVISIRDVNGIFIGNYSSGANWSFIFDVNANFFELSTDNEKLKVSGNLEISLQFDATLASLETEITSDKLTIEKESKNTLSNINVLQTINFAVMPSNYSLTVDSLKLVSESDNTAINAIANSIPLAGYELLDINEYFVDLDSPDNGVLNLSGKNSSAKVSIMPGERVSIDVDTNGDSISEEMVFSNWSNIETLSYK